MKTYQISITYKDSFTSLNFGSLLMANSEEEAEKIARNRWKGSEIKVFPYCPSLDCKEFCNSCKRFLTKQEQIDDYENASVCHSLCGGIISYVVIDGQIAMWS